MDIRKVIARLAETRPVFHSEADLQHALAWECQQLCPDASVRLEYSPSCVSERIHVDIWLALGDRTVALELKYKTRGLKYQIGGEVFQLQNHAAQCVSRYDFIKDIDRLERLCVAADATGYALMLTNDSAYWRPQSKESVDAEFRLHEGRRVQGVLAWDPRAGRGTTKNRESPISVRGAYDLVWHDYSRIQASGSSYDRFRFLLVEIRSR